jgi:hypothetical protein
MHRASVHTSSRFLPRARLATIPHDTRNLQARTTHSSPCTASKQRSLDFIDVHAARIQACMHEDAGDFFPQIDGWMDHGTVDERTGRGLRVRKRMSAGARITRAAGCFHPRKMAGRRKPGSGRSPRPQDDAKRLRTDSGRLHWQFGMVCTGRSRVARRCV